MKIKRLLSMLVAAAMVLCLLPLAALAEDVYYFANENIKVTYALSGNVGTCTSNGTSLTATATGYKQFSIFNASSEMTVTLRNISGQTGKIVFDYTPTPNGGTITIGSTTVSAAGHYESGNISNNGTLTVSVKSPAGSGTSKIVMTNFAMSIDVACNITFLKPENGTATAGGVDLNAIEGDSYTFENVNFNDGVQVTATPASGFKFYKWVDQNDNTILDTANGIIRATSDVTVHPVFYSTSAALFGVGSRIFADLNSAVTAAQNGSDKKIVLLDNGVLPEGDYSIPSGVTLLIPMDEANTVYTNEPEIVYGSHVNPTAFRVLTMAAGANLTIENGGALCLCSKLCSSGQLAGWNGTPTGPDGRINMNSGSTITVKNGGNLYCWGYIYGRGSVAAESGATVYEAFQIKDWRGGTSTSSVIDYAFIINQYYVQNIEVPLTLYAGATEKLYSAANANSTAYSMGVTFIGNSSSSAMFRISSGFIVKDYIEETDRLQIEVYGSVSISPMSMTGLPIVGSINTADYILPITNNITINLHTGTATINQDIEMLPGSEINVGRDVVMNIANGTEVYLYDNDDWGNFTGSARLYVIGYSVANGTTAKRNDASLVDAKLDVNGIVNVNGKLFTSAGGANITSSLGSDGTNGKIVLNAAPTATTTIYECENNSTKTAVSFTAAKLLNEDGSYFETAGKPAGTEIPYVNGEWGGSIPVYYTITWLDDDGTELGTTQVAEGELPTFEEPTKDETDEYTYTFAGWDPEVVEATADATYTATYNAVKKTYTITWMIDGESEEETYEYGAMPAHEDPVKEGNAQYSYTFTGWDPEIVSVTGNATYTAQFSETVNTYTLTIDYVDENGATVADQYTATLEYGAEYSVTSPTVEGYKTETTVVEGVMGGQNVSVTVVYTKVYVPTLLGDVNCDGMVDFSDASALAAFLLGGDPLPPQGFANANANMDDAVSIADITAIYAIIFSAVGIMLN